MQKQPETAQTTEGAALKAPIVELPHNEWRFEAPADPNIAAALERGDVLVLPHLPFGLLESERGLLDPSYVSPKRKNISFNVDRGALRGVDEAVSEEIAASIQGLLERYHASTHSLITHLIPQYKGKLKGAVNTLRLNKVDKWGESNSFRKDDRRLHVDAFPSRPLQGQRILRIFTNVNPEGFSREWRVGEPFPQLAERLVPKIKPYSSIGAWFLNAFQITKSYRTHYDHIMLQMHDNMKMDQEYQDQGIQWDVDFRPGTTWICFSDQTPHAAMGGQYMLEQTFHLDVEDMVDPGQSPLKVLEGLMGKPLV